MSDALIISLQPNTVTQILLLSFLSFLLSMIITPIYTQLAYKYKWWKRQRSEAWAGGVAKVYQRLHAAKHRRNIPTMAGSIIVISVGVVTFFV